MLPFSVVVATRNRLDLLQICLGALLRSDYPNFEIIIVNDASSDGTKKFLKNLTDERLKIFHSEKNLGAAEARNAGVRLARYDYIAFTDDDCAVHKDWLKELAKTCEETKTDFVIGQTFYISPNYRGYFPERLVRNLNANWPMSGNLAYRKKTFLDLGGFDKKYFPFNNEDTELGIRAVSRGFTYARNLKALVFHQPAVWTRESLLRSARNASVWPLLKRAYPRHYRHFGGPVRLNFLVNPIDYLFIIALPILLPVLLARYFYHGKKNLKIFFTKWPIYLFLRRYYVYKEALRHRVLMF